MKIKMWRRVFGIIMVCCLLGESTQVIADESEGMELIEQEVLSFANTFSNKEVSIDKMIPIIDTNEDLIGYSVCLESNGEDYGYVNYELGKENPITEFAIGQGNSHLNVASSDEENIVLVSEGLGNYRVATVSDYTKYDSFDAIYSRTYLMGGYTITAPKYTSKYSSTKSMISQDEIIDLTGQYACMVLALTEIAYQEGVLYGNSVAGTFNKIWRDTVTTTIDVWDDGTTIGSTAENFAVYGMEQYLEDMGEENSEITSTIEPTFSFFTDIIDNNKSGVLSYQIALENGTTSWHAINVVGYCRTMLNGVYYNYLIVADGWHDDAVRYIAFNRIDFVHSCGIKIAVQ